MTITALSVIIAFICQFIVLLLIGKKLSVQLFGTYTFTMTLVGFSAMVSDLGLGSLFFKSENLNKYMYQKIRNLVLINSFFVSLIVGLIFCFSKTVRGSEPNFVWISIILAIIVVFNSINSISVLVTANQGEVERLARIEIILSIVNLGFTVSMILLTNGLISLVLPALIQSVLKQSILEYLLKRNISEQWVAANGTLEGAKIGYWDCLPQVGERLLNHASANIDKLVLGITCGHEVLGIYAAAQQLAFKPFQVISQTVSRIVPKILLGAKLAGDEVFNRAYTNIQNLLLAIALIVHLAVLFNADSAVNLIYSQRYGGVVQVLPMLLVIASVHVYESHFGIALLIKSGPKPGLVLNLIAFVFMVLILLINQSSTLFGFVFTVMMYELFVRLPIHFIFRRRFLKIPLERQIEKLLLCFVPETILAIAVFYALNEKCNLNPVEVFFVSAIVCGIMVFSFYFRSKSRISELGR